MIRRMDKRVLALLLGIVFALSISGCAQVITDNNYTLASGETLSGDLILPSANAIIAENAHITGSVVMLCCNLIVNGQVDGDILVVSGNMMLGPTARVGGNIS